jgi:hypothetical protein
MPGNSLRMRSKFNACSIGAAADLVARAIYAAQALFVLACLATQPSFEMGSFRPESHSGEMAERLQKL